MAGNPSLNQSRRDSGRGDRDTAEVGRSARTGKRVGKTVSESWSGQDLKYLRSAK